MGRCSTSACPRRWLKNVGGAIVKKSAKTSTNSGTRPIRNNTTSGSAMIEHESNNASNIRENSTKTITGRCGLGRARANSGSRHEHHLREDRQQRDL